MPTQFSVFIEIPARRRLSKHTEQKPSSTIQTRRAKHYYTVIEDLCHCVLQEEVLDEEERREATAQFQEIQAAFEQLSKGRRLDLVIGPMTRTELISACEGGDLSTVQQLLRESAEINATDSTGRSPLMFAAQAGHVEVMELLLQRQADLNLRNCAGHTCVMFAVGGGIKVNNQHERAQQYLRAVQLLLDEGAPVNGVTSYGLSALMLASTSVLQQGPNPSEKPSQQPVIGVKEPPVILKITKKKNDFSKLPEDHIWEPQSSGEQGPDDGTSPVPEPLPDEVVETDGPRASRSSVMPEPPEEWPVEETPEVPTEAAEEAPTEAAQVVNEESRRKRRDKHRDRERRDDKEIFG
eukprot:g29449.t1